MRNKVEILRAICFTAEDMETIKNLGDSFSKLEIEFMVEFKKIYELGLDQLELFINKLDKEGKDLDEYTIQYYVDELFNGPLGTYAKELSKDKLYFTPSPESMGRNANITASPSNVTLFEKVYYPLGAPVDVFNKLPPFIQKVVTKSIEQTEEVFRSGIKSSTVHDNTLPIIDKAPQQRYEKEPTGEWVHAPNGSYVVKDRYFKKVLDKTSKTITEYVKGYLGDENFRMLLDKKLYYPFDSTKNTSTATNNKIEREYVENSQSVVITVDLMGDVFDSEEKRAKSLKIANDSKDKIYDLHTNEGQLGDP